MWKHDARRAECFHTISSFPNFHECGRRVSTQFLIFPISTCVDITIYQYRKNVLYLFYNIAQRNVKKEIFRSFHVDIELYQHGS